ncbi:MAG TPA: carboxypeptidase-like regulatory domain-containing protein [Minicystis sp.]|nr:carboxypeptidase-like regulatory domain-containing protein [Minicystis sp.]
MDRTWLKRFLLVGLAGAWVGGAWAACGGSGNNAASSNSFGGGGSASTSTGNGGRHKDGGNGNGGNGGSGGLNLGDSGGCVPSTCQELDANCGFVTDPKCGGVVMCGDCPDGQSCGNGGPNKCGTGSTDGCSPQSCAQQNANCGQIGDGCGNTISCGSCSAPKTCGGASPNQCGCTGVCSQIPDCANGTTTTLTGRVLDPAGKNPLYNALVYIPNDPNDPGLQPFPAGITCDVCGATAAGNPLVTAYTAPDGTFTLQNVPVGQGIKLVVQLGRWRRQFNVDITSSCAANSVPANTLTMPKNHTEGDIPRIAIVTGAWDAVECTLLKMGVDPSEFTNPNDPSGAHINMYLAAESSKPDPNVYGDVFGHGARINGTTPQESVLFGTSGGQPTINQYDLTILECEGYEQNEDPFWSKLAAYTAAGGRVFTSDFAYGYMIDHPRCDNNGPCPNGGSCYDTTYGYPCGVFYNTCICSTTATNPAYAGVASWDLDQNSGGSPNTGHIDLVSNPKGMAFQQWLEIVGSSTPGSGTVSLNPVYHNSDSIVAPTQQWLYSSTNYPVHFTFNAPVGGQPQDQCGRVVFSDWHAEDRSDYTDPPGPPPRLSRNVTFPNECDNLAMTPQQAILEFMLFDLTSCVQPYQPLCTPTDCASQGIECGPAGDGCGDLIDCGMCPNGEFCGGAGPGKCGMQNNCTPETCMSQNIECGKAGDGCGNVLDCGNCPTGQICGLNGPGKCGSTH